jgi:hypothetical protein
MKHEEVNLRTLQVEPNGEPQNCESYFSAGERIDGTPLTEAELDSMTEDAAWAETLYELAWIP